jgi:hypothetical protein
VAPITPRLSFRRQRHEPELFDLRHHELLTSSSEAPLHVSEKVGPRLDAAGGRGGIIEVPRDPDACVVAPSILSVM